MFCMHIPPINLDFKKPFFCWAEHPGIFPELYPDGWDMKAYKTNPRLVAWGDVSS